MKNRLSAAACLPEDHQQSLLVGRIWSSEFDGPTTVLVQRDGVYDLSRVAATSSQLLNLNDPAMSIRQAATLRRLASFDEVLENSAWDARDKGVPWFLAPCDLQPIKASGVTFVASLLERVIEEQARGNPSKAESVRRRIASIIGDNLAGIKPGSPQALRLKDVMIAEGVWSQYLEVGIGPDAEIFTKSQPMSAVGIGAEIGILSSSEWNNPEPEVVLAVNSSGRCVGATLGNDVNLRDFEGRSALLLGKAKDNNASCAIGPFVRLFDSHFTIDDVRRLDVGIDIEGPDGFALNAVSSMGLISRDPLEIVSHAIGPNHQYPDGLMLFLGTMFSPTKDRFVPGGGFTHMLGDVVTVHTPKLGSLVNQVNRADRIPPWTFGVTALMVKLAQRGLI
jgi:fumarylacetoacetate (FAA) hydrolase family protein